MNQPQQYVNDDPNGDPSDIPVTAKMLIGRVQEVALARPDLAAGRWFALLVAAADAIDETVQTYVAQRTPPSELAQIMIRSLDTTIEQARANAITAPENSATRAMWTGRAEADELTRARLRALSGRS